MRKLMIAMGPVFWLYSGLLAIFSQRPVLEEDINGYALALTGSILSIISFFFFPPTKKDLKIESGERREFRRKLTWGVLMGLVLTALIWIFAGVFGFYSVRDAKVVMSPVLLGWASYFGALLLAEREILKERGLEFEWDFRLKNIRRIKMKSLLIVSLAFLAGCIPAEKPELEKELAASKFFLLNSDGRFQDVDEDPGVDVITLPNSAKDAIWMAPGKEKSLKDKGFRTTFGTRTMSREMADAATQMTKAYAVYEYCRKKILYDEEQAKKKKEAGEKGSWIIGRYHPELLEGEIYLSDVTLGDFEESEWKTKRLGKVVYDSSGKAIGEAAERFRPLFVKRIELEAAGIDMRK